MNERMQQGPGAVAAVGWLLSGTYLALTTPGLPFFSWAVFWFLLTGIFCAPLVIGLPVYALQRSLPKFAGNNPNLLMAASLALLLGEAALIFLAARFLFARNMAAAFATQG